MKRKISGVRLAALVALSVMSSVLVVARAAGQQPSAVAGATKAAPTGRALEALTDQVASELRCPVCRQLSVKDSQAELSRKVKDLIREKLAAGESPAEVRAYFVSKYGEWILLSPPKHGVTLFVWVLPIVALAGGAGILVLFLRRWVGTDGHDADTGADGNQGDLSAPPA